MQSVHIARSSQTKRTGQEETNLLLLMTVDRYLTPRTLKDKLSSCAFTFCDSKAQFSAMNTTIWCNKQTLLNTKDPTTNSLPFLITISTSLKKLHSSNSSLYLIPNCVYQSYLKMEKNMIK